MCLTLTLNAAEKHVQFLLSNADNLLFASDEIPAKGGTELLPEKIRLACAELAVSPRNIRKIATVAGPGNFMGIRLTLAFAAALARANDAEQAGLDYLQCVAATVASPAFSKSPKTVNGKTWTVPANAHIRVLTTATKTTVHCGDYQMDKNGIPQPLDVPFLLEIPQTEEDCAVIRNSVQPDILAGSGSLAEIWRQVYPDSICPNCTNASESTAGESCEPDIPALLLLTQHAKWSKHDPAPVYLKLCDALQNFSDISRNFGRDPKQAQATLDKLLKQGLEGNKA